MPRRKNSIRRIKVTIELNQPTYSKLSEHAEAHGIRVALEARRAVELYLQNIQREYDATWQSPLEHRMQNLENRLAFLMAKLARVCGQSLWFSTLPYTKGGLPNKPLPQEAFQILWDNSRQFAAEWLKYAI